MSAHTSLCKLCGRRRIRVYDAWVTTTTATSALPTHYEMPIRQVGDAGRFVEAGDGVTGYNPKRRKATSQTGTYRYNYNALGRVPGGIPTMRTCPAVGQVVVMFANHKQHELRVVDVVACEMDAHGRCGWVRLVLIDC